VIKYLAVLSDYVIEVFGTLGCKKNEVVGGRNGRDLLRRE
jgi:hypothetical protein